MPATTTIGNSRPLAACMDISQTRASLAPFRLVGLRQQRQAVDEAAERRVRLARFVFARGGHQLHQVLDARLRLFAVVVAEIAQVARAVQHQTEGR